MKIVGETLGMLLLAIVVAEPISAVPCKISQSVYRDADGKGFELVFREPTPETPTSKATATITHSQVGQLYNFKVTQSVGYGTIHLILIDYEGALEPRSFPINFFDRNLISATPLWFGEETQTPKYAFIADLGASDYYRSQDSFYTSERSSLVPPLGDMMWVYERCQKFAYAQTQSYPTDEELQKLMPDFQSQVDYWNQYEEPEHQKEAKAFAENWSRRDPTVAPFLGSWVGWEQQMDIYPSTTEGQICIIYTDGTAQVVGFWLGNVLNQRIYTDRDEVIFRQGNYVGSAWNRDNPTGEAGVHAYGLFAPAEVPTRAYWRDWDEGDQVIEQFNAAGCITDL